MPKRIQMRRTKGWRKPAGVVYVGRPTKWGNPYRELSSYSILPNFRVEAITREMAVRLFRLRVETVLIVRPDALEELRGKDLACWCPLDQPCHADVLLELANGAREKGE